jgi:hypothetical protein
MPGFLASFLVEREQQTASLVMANATAGLDGAIGADLLELLSEHEPRVVPAWVPAAEVADADREILGPWYWGVTPLAVRLAGPDSLELVALRGFGRSARFARRDGRWLGLDGYYAGETLRVVRGDDGAVSHLDISTFVLTRQPYDPPDVQPGGVEPPGWRTV